jgi:alpha-galactosidase
MFRSVGWAGREDYPELAVKPTFLQDAEAAVDPVNTVIHLWVVLLLPSLSMMSQSASSPPCGDAAREILAVGLSREIVLDAAQPAPEWDTATPVTFCRDWQGNNSAPDRQTEVRALWSAETLYVRFECRYRELNVFPDSDPDGRRDRLWERDVAEAFLQPDPSRPDAYKEFEVSPNGFWIDLDISPRGRPDLKSGMKRSVATDGRARRWAAEIAIPMKSLAAQFDPEAIWRVNFFRVEGRREPRGYYAWQPTRTPQPNFHVPSAFGRMRFAGGKR